MEEDLTTSLASLLSAYPWKQVQEAYDKLVAAREAEEKEVLAALERGVDGWELHEGPVPEKWEWRSLAGKVFIRNPEVAREIYAKKAKVPVRFKDDVKGKAKRTDTSVRPVSRIVCPDCGGGLYQEAVCPACEDGKKGKKIRLLCGECDFTELL